MRDFLTSLFPRPKALFQLKMSLSDSNFRFQCSPSLRTTHQCPNPDVWCVRLSPLPFQMCQLSFLQKIICHHYKPLYPLSTTWITSVLRSRTNTKRVFPRTSTNGGMRKVDVIALFFLVCTRSCCLAAYCIPIRSFLLDPSLPAKVVNPPRPLRCSWNTRASPKSPHAQPPFLVIHA